MTELVENVAIVDEDEASTHEEVELILKMLGPEYSGILSQGVHNFMNCIIKGEVDKADRIVNELGRTFIDAPMHALLSNYAFQMDDDNEIERLGLGAIKLAMEGSTELSRKVAKTAYKNFSWDWSLQLP